MRALEPKVAPCGWHCPHRRPACTGPFGYGNGNGDHRGLLLVGLFSLCQENAAPYSRWMQMLPHLICLFVCLPKHTWTITEGKLKAHLSRPLCSSGMLLGLLH